MPTYLLTEGFQFGSVSQAYSISKSADAEVSVGPVPIATGQTAFLVNLAIDVSDLKSLFIVCDQAVTIKTNSSGAPDNTLTLIANQPLVWYNGSYYTNLLTVDVTKIYVANSSGATANLYIFALQDPTP